MRLITQVKAARSGRWHRVHCPCGRETLTLEEPVRVECYKCGQILEVT